MRRDAVGVLRRILPLAAAVRCGVRTLRLVSLGAALAIALVVLVDWTPGDREDWAGFTLLCVLLAVPPAVLFAFSFVLGEVVELPDKLRRYPDATREHMRSYAPSRTRRGKASGPPGAVCRGARGGSPRSYARPASCWRRTRHCLRS